MSVDINAFNKSFRQEEQIDPKIYDFIMETNRCSLSLWDDEFGGEPTFKMFINITENGQKLINYVKKIYKHEEFDLLKYFFDMQVIELDVSSGIEIGPEKIRWAEKNFIQQHVEYIEACYNSIKCSFKLYRSLRKIVSKQKLKLILDLLFDYISRDDHCPFGEYTLSKNPKLVEIQFIDPSILKTPMFCESYKYSLKRKAQNSPYLPNDSTDGDYYLWGSCILCTLQEQIHLFIKEHEEQCKTQLVVHKGIHYSERSECKCCGKKIYTEYMTYYKCCDCYYCPICLLDRLIPFYDYILESDESESDESEDGKLIVNDPFNYAMTLRQCPLCKKDQGYILYFEIDRKATPPEYFKQKEQSYTESSSDSSE